MATQIQLRRGTTTEHNTFTGAVGELTYDTELARLRIHDGATVGGKVIVGTRIVTTPIDVNLENTTGVRIINTLGNTNLPFNVYGALNVYSNENFATGALRVYQTFQTDIFGDYFTRSWNGSVWSAWERVVKSSEKNSEAFGVNQSWQDVTASRAKNVVYTNNTGKPIEVAIKVAYIDNDWGLTVTVGGVNIGKVQGNAPSGNGYWQTTLNFTVPNLVVYSVSGGSDVFGWSELR